MDQLVAILAVIASGFADIVLQILSEAVASLTGIRIEARRGPQEPYGDRVRRLTETLSASASEAETIAREMEELLRHRSESLAAAERSLVEMETKERDLAARLENLRQIAPDSVRVFEDILDRRMNASERSARSYFVWGVVATVIVGVLGLWLAPVVTGWIT